MYVQTMCYSGQHLAGLELDHILVDKHYELNDGNYSI